MNILSKKLKTKFMHVDTLNFAITGSDLCHECIERHKELVNGRTITFEDLQYSCYCHVFYEIKTFSHIIPILLRELMLKDKFEIEQYIIEIFLKEMRTKQLLVNSIYTIEQKQIIIEILNYMKSVYYMDDFQVWDNDKEKIVHHFEEESIYTELSKTLVFWETNF